jgi:hypothetical protein
MIFICYLPADFFGGNMKKQTLNSNRVRKINGSFSFIPHKFIREGFINELNSEELLLYFFLILVSDSQGISYYSDKNICKLTGLSFEDIDESRTNLKALDLIAFNSPVYQILELPFKPVQRKSIYHIPDNFHRLQKIAKKFNNG